MVGKWIYKRAWVAVAVLLTACAPAQAFYWHDWPGSRVRPRPSLIPPTNTPGNPPGTPNEPQVPNPPDVPPILVNPPLGPPQQTPEPSTGLIGLLGLGALTAARRWRKKCEQ